MSNAREEAHAVGPHDEFVEPRKVFKTLLWTSGDLWRVESHRLLEELQRDSLAAAEPTEAT